MSKSLLSFLVSELKVVRIICKAESCGAVSEIPVDKLGRVDPYRCHYCGSMIRHPDKYNALAQLATALRNLAEDADKYDVEFIIPQ